MFSKRRQTVGVCTVNTVYTAATATEDELGEICRPTTSFQDDQSRGAEHWIY